MGSSEAVILILRLIQFLLSPWRQVDVLGQIQVWLRQLTAIIPCALVGPILAGPQVERVASEYPGYGLGRTDKEAVAQMGQPAIFTAGGIKSASYHAAVPECLRCRVLIDPDYTEGNIVADLVTGRDDDIFDDDEYEDI